MKLKSEILSEVNNAVETRRFNAKKRKEERIEEVYNAIPGYREADAEVQKTGAEILKKSINSKPDDAALAALKEKLTAKIRERDALLAANGFEENYLTDVYTCSKCCDTGFVSKSGQNVMCECKKTLLTECLFENSGIRPKYGFDSFDLSLYEGDDLKKATRAFDEAKAFVENYAEGKTDDLLFRGGTGVGKSFLAAAIAYELIKKGVQVIYLTSSEILTAMTYFGGNEQRAHKRELMETLVFEADVLVIDDLGAERMSEACFKLLLDILNRRTESRSLNKHTIITTNLTPKKIMDTYDERIFSRLCSFEAFELSGNDLRLRRR